MRKQICRGILYLWLGGMTLILLFPVICTVKDGFVLYGMEGFADFLLWDPAWLQSFWISMGISMGAALGSALVAVPAAYVFAKAKFRGREVLFLVYVMVMMMPFQVTQLPHYMTAKSLGTYDTPWALLLPGIFAPLSVFLLTQLARAIPDEMLEAARLETDSVWKILWYIVCPNLRSGIVCMMVLQFTEYWGMAAELLVLMETKEIYPLALKLAQASPEIPAAVAASFIMLIPPWLLYGYFKEEIREGMKGYYL